MSDRRDGVGRELLDKLRAVARRLRVAKGDLRATGLRVVEVRVADGKVTRRVISNGDAQTN